MERIGLLSDSHGRASTTEQAVSLLVEQNVDLLIHLGDIGTMEVLDAMVVGLDEAKAPAPPVRIVFGNTDWDANSLARYAEQLGIVDDHPMGRIEAGGKQIAFTHGHQEQLMRQAVADGVDYLLHGHTHAVRDEREGDTRVINPGALFRAAAYTVAVLEPASDQVRFLNI